MNGKTLIKWTVFLLCLLMVVPISMAADFEGKVIGVLDGDTIDVLHEKKPERIRLYGIDCPEKGQPFGQRAKQAASALLFGMDVRIETHGKDKHRRTLGTVFQGEMNVNQVLVREGWCWWFSKFVPKDGELQQFEQEEKEAKKGLWADPNPTPPRLYRRLDAGAYP
jgi:endonuclease YncB( thermonuclease family)